MSPLILVQYCVSRSLPQEASYEKILEAFTELWRQKNMSTDLRLYISGAVYQAGVRQGDEVFPREIFQKVLLGQQLTQAELLRMVESVHNFVIVRQGIRKQYLGIIVHMITRYLDRQVNVLASMN